ncbi:MAG: four-carbon acid sugar kinase family protein [Verrucomicrobia bacterium]|jgi:uncharacterized protein YgbK (DUF1537 family)|nr:four-carbon acid sugar kinase family protein [Verrucomicrobiota bacterium]
MPGDPHYGFYGDDFTGSTDALEVLARAGLRTLLFLDIPDEEGMALMKDYEAVGIAGKTRSLGREAIMDETERVFSWFSRLDLACFHYKVCSTFDSSPQHGNIGVAVEQGQRIFRNPWVPLLIGYPALQRWVAFSQLFARDLEGISRLDRHSTMSRHPVTPMDEADIRRHLEKQTAQRITDFNLVDLRADPAGRMARMREIVAGSPSGILVFDTVDEEDLRRSGEILREMLSRFGPFTVGSSAVEAAWVASRPPFVDPDGPAGGLERVEQLLVMSGSASPKTARQIAHAREKGWSVLPLEPWRWFEEGEESALLEPVVDQALAELDRGRNVVMCSCEGPEDPAIRRTREAAARTGWRDPLHRIGKLQGKALRRILDENPLPRVCVAGGDTSGYVAGALHILGLEYAASIDPGGPVCRARSRAFPQLQICLKGGQVGSDAYFESVRAGRKIDP